MPAKLDLDSNDDYCDGGFFYCDLSPTASEKLVEEFRRKVGISSLQLDVVRAGGPDDSRLGMNTTERVPVPSSEHVAEIVGRQGYKIKALRTSTNTYIRTPVRGEEPVFVVTGRKEGVAHAKEYILASAQHFTQIRANRGGGASTAPSLQPTLACPSLPPPVTSKPPPTMSSPLSNSAAATKPGHVTIEVRVPASLVGLVIGPKGSTIKRIQKQTFTFIMTPNREKEPVFRVSGLPANVDMARLEIQSHIINRTAGRVITPLITDPMTEVDDVIEAETSRRGRQWSGPMTSSSSPPNSVSPRMPQQILGGLPPPFVASPEFRPDVGPPHYGWGQQTPSPQSVNNPWSSTYLASDLFSSGGYDWSDATADDKTLIEATPPSSSLFPMGLFAVACTSLRQP